MKVCGSLRQLGGWDPAKAPSLEYTEGRWKGTVRLPISTEVAYKYIVTNDSGDVLAWEEGEDRVVRLEADRCVRNPTFVDAWGVTKVHWSPIETLGSPLQHNAARNEEYRACVTRLQKSGSFKLDH